MASEHGGTHVDAPLHCAKNGLTVDQIPLAEWLGPAAKIDTTRECAKNRDYLLTVDDIKKWKRKNGHIPKGVWVVMNTGICTQFYHDAKRILGTDKKGLAALTELRFPAFSQAAAEFLVKTRNVKGVALDTPSIDYGKSPDFPVHRVICREDKLVLESIANLDKLPVKGATGAPARAFAILP